MWFKRKVQTPKPNFLVIARDPIKLRLAEFRSNKSLAGDAQKIIAIPGVRLMLDVLRNEHPGQWVLPPGATTLDRIRAQCLAEGYTMALANFEAMGEFTEMTQMPEPTFEQEERQNQ
jgi:hypothetical protein